MRVMSNSDEAVGCGPPVEANARYGDARKRCLPCSIDSVASPVREERIIGCNRFVADDRLTGNDGELLRVIDLVTEAGP